MNNKIIYGGMGIFFLVAMSGMLYMQETGKNVPCKTGWQLQDDAVYRCDLVSGNKYYYCSKVWNSTNTQNYWCKELTVVNYTESIEPIIVTEVIDLCKDRLVGFIGREMCTCDSVTGEYHCEFIK